MSYPPSSPPRKKESTISMRDFEDLVRKMDEADVPQKDRVLVVDPATASQIFNSPGPKVLNSETMLRRGIIGSFMGVTVILPNDVS